MVGHVEDELQTIGRSIYAAFPTRQRHPLRALDTKAMEFAGHDQELRAALFRLVDVTPACTSLDDLARHLTAFLDEVDERPPPIAAAMRMSQTRAGRAALGAAAAAGVRHMAHRFIVGETPRAALRSLRHLWEHGAAISLDLLGEATVTQPEADRYAARCLDALETLAEATPAWPARPQLESDSLGPLPRVNVAVKVSALTPLLRPEAPEVGRDDAARRMLPLLLRAKELGAHLHIDMESVDTLEATMRLVFDLLEQPELRDGPSTGVVLQAYLRDSPEQLEQVLDWARASGREPPLVVRLVKGAYWDQEIVEARQHGWTPPVFEQKAESDRNFERLTRRLIEGWPHVRPAIASHNLRSVAHAVAASRAAGRAESDIELQVLRGLGDDLAAALADQGMRVRIYCPVGDMVAGMAYLVRRLLENTANESFLSEQQRGVPLEELLAAP
jgi:proline dehydrogenase